MTNRYEKVAGSLLYDLVVTGIYITKGSSINKTIEYVKNVHMPFQIKIKFCHIDLTKNDVRILDSLSSDPLFEPMDHLS